MTTDPAVMPQEERCFLCRTGVALLAAMSLVVGCGRSLPAVAPVSGTVTRAGKPVTQGMVMFQPENGRMGVGPIDADGRFTITTFATGDGAIIGRHKVAIESFTQSKTGVVTWIVPEQYALPVTTPLTADVKPDSNTIDFNVP